jgi:crotonobetainyl-CoA:carnitine CoA-transferase CaiB-like acyl-CoA transferase
MRPFEGIRILDCTHVLAGPFAAYQLAVLGADVVTVEQLAALRTSGAIA